MAVANSHSEELGAETVVPDRQAEHREARRLECRQPLPVGRIRFGSDGHEAAVAAVLIRAAERFIDDRQQALAVFAGALGDQLFDPQAEGSERRGQRQGQLVAPFQRRCPDERAQLQAGVGVVVLLAALGHGGSAGEQRIDRRTDDRRGDEAE